MAYDRVNWNNNASPPVNAENLNQMDAGIEDVDARVAALEAAGTGELDYTEFNTDIQIATAGTTIVTAGPVDFDGTTTVEIEFHCRHYKSGGGMRNLFYLDEAVAGQIAEIGEFFPDLGGGGNKTHQPLTIKARLTPPAGTLTYSIRATCSTNLGATAHGATDDIAGVILPSFLKITKV